MDAAALDAAIQHALAGLYPPFEATAPTILGQVFRLLDSDFRGDGLSFLLDFLIPAKRLCEQVREAACAPYVHCLFLHEGWPLCLRDEIVVHLAPLSPLLLRQGDFYLQVERREEQSVRVTLKCLSSDLRKVDEKPVPESSYPLLFTPEWLEAINGDFEGHPLHNCLVATENGIAHVPWARIASPQFVDHRLPAMYVPSKPAGVSSPLQTPHLSSPQELPQATSPGSQGSVGRSWAKGKGRTPGARYPGLIKVDPPEPGEVAFGMDSGVSQGLEGDYVALLGFSRDGRGQNPHREAVVHSEGAPRAQGERSQGEPPLRGRTLLLTDHVGRPPLGRRERAKPSESGEEPCAWSLRGKVSHKTPAPEAERRPHLRTLEELRDPTGEPAVSKTWGSLGVPATTVQLRPGPLKMSCPHLSPAAPAASASETETEKPTKTTLDHHTASEPEACAGQSIICAASASGRQLLPKGQSPPPAPPEKAPLQHTGPGKTPSSGSCLWSHETKAPGKDGTTRPRASGPAADSDSPSEEQAGFPKTSADPPGRGLQESPRPEPRIQDLGVELLHSGIACLPGGRDRAGRPLLLVSTSEEAWEAPWCVASGVTELLVYLCGIPRQEDRTKGLVVVIDGRKGPLQPGLVSALQKTQAVAPASISMLFFLGEKADARSLQALPVQVEVLTSLKTLSHHVDPCQLPAALEGTLSYCHREWVQFFQELDPFLTDLRRASSLLGASIQELEKGDPPGGVQEATRCLKKSKWLMESVLRDPGLLDLQREGGATLARLRQEAGGLDSNLDIRSHLAEAAALYSRVDEQLHVLVTSSNHLLGRLELRVRLGHLEAAIHQVSGWMEKEGSQCLQALVPTDACVETVERAHVEFEDFFMQAVAQYRRGLELSKQAAQLGAAAAGGAGEAGGTEFPELAAFASTQRAFQARLTHFYMAAERQRTDLETLLHLYRFSKKITWFHMDCQDLLTQLKLGKAPRASPGDQRRLHRYLQRLASEFPTEKLTAMGLQVASLSRAGLGQELWDETRARHEEIQSLLATAMAHCAGAAPPTPHAPHPAPGGSRPASKDRGLPGAVTARGRGDRPRQEPLGVELVQKSYWPPRALRGRRDRDVQAEHLRHEAEQPADAREGRGLPEPAPERLLASLFSWQPPPRQSQAPRPAGGSFSSEGTDSQTSLEDSPQTSPPASL